MAGLFDDLFTKNPNDFWRTPALFTERKLSPFKPRPMVCRIEPLQGSARQRYLGGLQRVGDKIRQWAFDNYALTDAATGQIAAFHGIMQDFGNQTFSMQPVWTQAAPGGGLLGSIKAVSKNLKGFSFIGDILEFEQAFVNVVENLTQTSFTATGSSSMPKFEGINMNDFSVDCGFYLPVQLNIARQNLRAIYKMAYPIQAGSKGGDLLQQVINENSAGFNESTTKFQTEAGTSILGGDPTGLVTAQTAEQTARQNNTTNANNTIAKGETDPAKIKNAQDTLNNTDTFVSDGIGKAIDVYQKVNDFFGRNITFNPFPVRVSLGNYCDLEPLVVKGVSVKFSKENFIVENQQMPLFCDVSITFGWWVRPRPDMQFFKLLDTEMIGPLGTPPITDEATLDVPGTAIPPSSVNTEAMRNVTQPDATLTQNARRN